MIKLQSAVSFLLYAAILLLNLFGLFGRPTALRGHLGLGRPTGTARWRWWDVHVSYIKYYLYIIK
jgi:hypothetical protein